MKLTLDVETNTTKRNGKLHLDPFEPDNTLVMVGMLADTGEQEIVVFDHADVEETKQGHAIVQRWLDETTVLIAHNAAYDLAWLKECGFVYDGPVWDTMLVEYVLQRGDKEPLGLKYCTERHDLTRKLGTLDEYYAKGYNTSEIPIAELTEYLEADLRGTQELCDHQRRRVLAKENYGLESTITLTNELCKVLVDTYRNGFAVDLDELDKVREQYVEEKEQLLTDLTKDVRELMGDTKINLSSPEQLSWVIYSKKPRDKNVWANSYNEFMRDLEWRDLVRLETDTVYKTVAKKCHVCNGKGYIRKTKKDGTPYAKENKCTHCVAEGFVYENTKQIAGLKFNAPNAKWASANGFKTSKANLQLLQNTARAKGMDKAVSFLSKVERLSAVETYLSSFVEGIANFTKPDGKLHVSLLQHRTATGRLSGANPNMQNMPRGNTFPVKKVFKSRWEGGQIMEADFAQLEFRVAAYLSQDKVAIEEVSTGFDVHSYTAQIISEAGQPTSRQEAKAHTFAPLYGATGYGRTKAEAAYYEHFSDKYSGVANWHNKLAEEALENRKITIPSGREYAFPNVQRRSTGGVTYFTNIKNYPVQGFATADIVPISLIHIHNLLKKFKSCIVNTVHDSIVIDVHPDEERAVIEVIADTNRILPELIRERWGTEFNVPLLLEAKIGPNWLDTKDVL